MNIDELAWDKMNGLLPAIVQHARSGQVLMLGYMNRLALHETLASQTVYFYSRSKERLWQKGESSGHILKLVNVVMDCDQDALLVLALPQGPTCHQNTISCFAGASFGMEVLTTIENVITERRKTGDDSSYVRSLLERGVNRIAQKVGEEAVEVAIAAISETEEAFCGEMADLLFHMQVLLAAKGLTFDAITQVLEARLNKFNEVGVSA